MPSKTIVAALIAVTCLAGCSARRQASLTSTVEPHPSLVSDNSYWAGCIECESACQLDDCTQLDMGPRRWRRGRWLGRSSDHAVETAQSLMCQSCNQSSSVLFDGNCVDCNMQRFGATSNVPVQVPDGNGITGLPGESSSRSRSPNSRPPVQPPFVHSRNSNNVVNGTTQPDTVKPGKTPMRVGNEAPTPSRLPKLGGGQDGSHRTIDPPSSPSDSQSEYQSPLDHSTKLESPLTDARSPNARNEQTAIPSLNSADGRSTDEPTEDSDRASSKRKSKVNMSFKTDPKFESFRLEDLFSDNDQNSDAGDSGQPAPESIVPPKNLRPIPRGSADALQSSRSEPEVIRDRMNSQLPHKLVYDNPPDVPRPFASNSEIVLRAKPVKNYQQLRQIAGKEPTNVHLPHHRQDADAQTHRTWQQIPTMRAHSSQRGQASEHFDFRPLPELNHLVPEILVQGSADSISDSVYAPFARKLNSASPGATPVDQSFPWESDSKRNAKLRSDSNNIVLKAVVKDTATPTASATQEPAASNRATFQFVQPSFRRAVPSTNQ